MTRSIPFEIFSTCPQSKDVEPAMYAARAAEVARWSEEAGCRGILVYTDNSLVDPWLVSQRIIEATATLTPLVAVQPVYMHPYTVAKMVASIGLLYERSVLLNMVAGGFRNDLLALDDDTSHEDRYARVVEYATIVKELLAGEGPVTFDGRFYTVRNLKMTPALPEHLAPGFFISGSSEDGLGAARALGATAVRYPRPPHEETPAVDAGELRTGIRVGIISRDDDDEAWSVALTRFPEDRKGQIAHNLAMRVSDSNWHHQLSESSGEPRRDADPYWLGPFHNYKTFCPYLVGSYDRVAAELARYMRLGFAVYILDIPASGDDLLHARAAFNRAEALAR